MNLKKALEAHDRAIELAPDEHFAYVGRANVKRSMRDWDGAIKDYSSAIELKPSMGGHYLLRGLANGSKGAYDEAISDFNQALRLEPDNVRAVGSIAHTQFRQKKHAEAIETYSKCMSMDAEDASYPQCRGICHFLLGHFKDALSDMENLSSWIQTTR